MSEVGRYVIIGAGAVGGVLAARLVQSGRPVLLVARGEHGRRIAADGLLLRHPDGTDQIRIDVAAGIDEVVFDRGDVLILAIKTQDADATISDLAGRPAGAGVVADLPLVTLQNGLDAERSALRRFRAVYGATIAIAASYLTPGEVVSPSRAPREGAIWIGRYPGGVDELSERLAADLSAAGFIAAAVENVRAYKSAKLLGNVGNGLDLLTGSDGDRERARDLLRAEAADVIQAAGLPQLAGGRLPVTLEIEAVEGHEPGRMSTWQSFARGASSEIDFLNGEIVLLARLYGRSAPVNERLQRLLGAEQIESRTLSALLSAVPTPEDEVKARMTTKPFVTQGPQWLDDWQAWHAERERAALAPYGLASAVGTTWLGESAQEVPPLPGEWLVRDGRVEGPDVVIPPGQSVEVGRFRVLALQRDGIIAVRVLDPQAVTRTELRGIEAFAPDPNWVFSGHFEVAPQAASIEIDNVDGRHGDIALAGTVSATIKGVEINLAAFPQASGGLHITFADQTNGHSTAQFRFLMLDAPGADGAVTLDFNRAILPPCAFTDHYLCPIPPAQNRLPFEVTAGETFTVTGEPR